MTEASLGAPPVVRFAFGWTFVFLPRQPRSG